MFTRYESKGAASSLRLSISRVWFFRETGHWPAQNISPLRRELESEIELLVQARDARTLRVARIASRREKAIRSRYEAMLQSN
jgi:hypothetical protein